MLHTSFLCTAAAVLFTGTTADLIDRSKQRYPDANSPKALFRRQDNVNSTCYSFGIDFVDAGSYFINSLSTANFTAVSQFLGCNDDVASILLVNDQTSDQYECTSVPTVPDNTAQISTCPIQKDQMTTGNWSIVTLGNNGDGIPFAYQRDFFLTVRPQQTETVSTTVTYNQTLTPTETATTTSTVDITSTISNSQTITVPAATRIVTITPPAVTTTTTSYITKTFRRWTKTQHRITEIITADCTVPPRPYWPDPKAHIIPTAIPLPAGLHIDLKNRADRAADLGTTRRRFEHVRGADIRARQLAAQKRELVARSADAMTITSTAIKAVNETMTLTAPTSSLPFVAMVTETHLTTLPPVTVKSGDDVVETMTAPVETSLLTTVGYTVTYVTKTLSLEWTYSTTTTPEASATACKQRGGHFGNGWEGGW